MAHGFYYYASGTEIRDMEQWFYQLALCMIPMFYETGLIVPIGALRIEIGNAETYDEDYWGQPVPGGYCWLHDDATIDIVLFDWNGPLGAAALLAHELVHASLPADTGHKLLFCRSARRIGLMGAGTLCDRPSPRFQRRVQPMLDYLRANNFGPKRTGN